MAHLAELDGVTHAIGGKDLLDDVGLSLHDGDRIGLVGHNGSGKSTLLSLLAGTSEPERGEIRRRRGARIASVEQFLPDALTDTATVDALDGDRWQAEALLHQLGFSHASLEYKVGQLSGGQQNRLMFARAVIQEPDLLLLDEPTNHLDLATIVTFEDHLHDLRCAFVLVSHDRAFLDAVTNRTVFLRDQRLYSFANAYSIAKTELDHMDQAAANARASEERKIESLRASAKRLSDWQRINESKKLARRVGNMERRIDKLESEKTFVTKGSQLDLSVDLGRSRAKEIVRIEDYDVAFGDTNLFSIGEFVIRPGERVALLGHNGVGKSTFIKKLVAEIPLRPQTQLGYYDQELEEAQSEKTLSQFVGERTHATSVEVRQRLIAAGFPYVDHEKKLSSMSGGERARTLFVVLSLSSPNFLVLDEPTNHIDIEGKEQLEEELIASDAAVLITSHDRRFIESVAERFLWIRDGGLIAINDPNEFFASPNADSTGWAKTHSDDQQPEADLLERVVELEEKLAADKARKPKFQKPKLQAEWQTELDELLRRLE